MQAPSSLAAGATGQRPASGLPSQKLTDLPRWPTTLPGREPPPESATAAAASFLRPRPRPLPPPAAGCAACGAGAARFIKAPQATCVWAAEGEGRVQEVFNHRSGCTRVWVVEWSRRAVDEKGPRNRPQLLVPST